MIIRVPFGTGITGLDTLKIHHSLPMRPYNPSMGILEGNRFHVWLWPATPSPAASRRTRPRPDLCSPSHPRTRRKTL